MSTLIRNDEAVETPYLMGGVHLGASSCLRIADLTAAALGHVLQLNGRMGLHGIP